VAEKALQNDTILFLILVGYISAETIYIALYVNEMLNLAINAKTVIIHDRRAGTNPIHNKEIPAIPIFKAYGIFLPKGFSKKCTATNDKDSAIIE